MTILTKSPRKVNRPAGFYDTPAPRPAPDLRLFLDDRRVIVKLHIKGEPAYRWHREVMTVEHPFMVNFLTGYEFIEEYRIAHIGLTVRAYRVSELTAPVSELAPGVSEITPRVSETRRAELETELESLRAELPHTLPGVCRTACKRQIANIEAELSEDVSETGPTPAPITPAMSEAQGLMSEYPELSERITRALALVEAGQTEFPQHNTRFDPAGFYGYRDCDCGDAVHRQPRAKFGIACKHTLAQEIAARVERTAWRVANQKLASDSERRAAALARNDYASPAAYRPAADPLNVKAQHPVYQFGNHRVK